MSGKTTGLFAPEDTITVGEFAVVILNGFFDGQKTVKSNDDHWADPYLNTLYDDGVLVSNLFLPLLALQVLLPTLTQMSPLQAM